LLSLTFQRFVSPTAFYLAIAAFLVKETYVLVLASDEFPPSIFLRHAAHYTQPNLVGRRSVITQRSQNVGQFFSAGKLAKNRPIFAVRHPAAVDIKSVGRKTRRVEMTKANITTTIKHKT